MSQVFTSTLSANFQVNETLALGYAVQPVNAQDQPSVSWASGSASGCANLHWEAKNVTLAGGASTTLVLSALVDGQGRSCPFANVAGIEYAASGRPATGYLNFGGAASHNWDDSPWGSGTLKVYDLAAFAASGSGAWPVTSGSKDQLKIANPTGVSVTFNLGLIGRDV